jgi:integrase
VRGRLDETKTDGSMRDIAMSQPVFDALMAQREVTYQPGGDTFVFANRNGEPLDVDNITNRVWYPLLRHLGLTKRRPYQTRHTFATLLLAAGENPEFVAR